MIGKNVEGRTLRRSGSPVAWNSLVLCCSEPIAAIVAAMVCPFADLMEMDMCCSRVTDAWSAIRQVLPQPDAWAGLPESSRESHGNGKCHRGKSNHQLHQASLRERRSKLQKSFA